MSDDIATKLVAAILGASASIIASTAAIHGSLTAAVGPFAQPGEASQLAWRSLTSAASKSSSSQWSSLGNHAKKDGSFKHLFKEYKTYIKYVKRYIEDYHDTNPEVEILPISASDGGFDKPIKMDVFWAYGVPGHEQVHTSLLFAYKSAFDNKFVMFKVDLQAGCDDIRLTNPDNEIMHHIKLCDGIDETIWNNYGGTVILSFNELICIIQSVMSSFPKKFDVLDANCIQFKNMVIAYVRKHFDANNDRSTVSTNNTEELDLTLPDWM